MIKAVEKFGKVCIAKLINRLENIYCSYYSRGEEQKAVVKDSASAPSSRINE